jgi:hypothetical protein
MNNNNYNSQSGKVGWSSIGGPDKKHAFVFWTKMLFETPYDVKIISR